MRTPFALAALATLCVVLVAADQSRVWRAPHMEAVPEWKRVPEPLPRGLELTLSFALKQQNLDLLEKTLLEVSDPRCVVSPPSPFPLSLTSEQGD